MAVVTNLNVIQLLDMNTGELLARLEASQLANICYFRFSPDGTKLFALEWDQRIQVWDLRRIREELRSLNSTGRLSKAHSFGPPGSAGVFGRIVRNSPCSHVIFFARPQSGKTW